MAQNDHKKPTAAGQSSFDHMDAAAFYRELDLKPDLTFLDLACGRGAYCLKASEIVGSAGFVYAVDLWQEGIEPLRARPVAENALNIKAFVSDAGRHIPLDDQVVDVWMTSFFQSGFFRSESHKQTQQPTYNKQPATGPFIFSRKTEFPFPARAPGFRAD